ncbi:MAG TPA: hypothetical protein VE197_21620 [Mycobacterium sp.]|nr:hypothetical protein [Mycobacterium sp.]
MLMALVSGEPGSLVGVVVHMTPEFTLGVTVAGCSARDLRPIGRIRQELEIEHCAHGEPDHRTTVQRTYCG